MLPEKKDLLLVSTGWFKLPFVKMHKIVALSAPKRVFVVLVMPVGVCVGQRFPPPELSTCSCVSLRWRFCLLLMWKSLHTLIFNSFFFEASDCRVKNKPQLISSTECHWAFAVCLGFNTCIFVVWKNFLCCFVWRVHHKVRQHLVKCVISFKELEVATS